MTEEKKREERRISEILTLLTNYEIPVTDQQARQLLRLYDLLIEKNKVMNLTAITEFEEVIRRHFLDSLSIVRDIDLSQADSLIDIGTGAGFPGLPIKILYPHINICYVDSVDKKLKFIEEVSQNLELTHYRAIHARAEDLARDPAYRDSFTVCTSRAVADLAVLSEYCLPFVKEQGLFVAYKSASAKDEIRHADYAVRQLGGRRIGTDTFEWEDLHRTLVVIEKEKPTPAKYPRKAGLPSRHPLHNRNAARREKHDRKKTL